MGKGEKEMCDLLEQIVRLSKAVGTWQDATKKVKKCSWLKEQTNSTILYLAKDAAQIQDGLALEVSYEDVRHFYDNTKFSLEQEEKRARDRLLNICKEIGEMK